MSDNITMDDMTAEYEPDNKTQRDALEKTWGKMGTWPECDACSECILTCQLVIDDYDGLLAVAEREHSID